MGLFVFVGPMNASAEKSQPLGQKREIVRLTNKDGDLVGACERALTEIFTRYDVDKDGALNESELDAYAKKTNGTETGFSDQEKQEITEYFEINAEGALTLRGFLQLYQLQTMSEPDETWKDLKTHGYNKYLEFESEIPTEATGDASSEAGVEG